MSSSTSSKIVYGSSFTPLPPADQRRRYAVPKLTDLCLKQIASLNAQKANWAEESDRKIEMESAVESSIENLMRSNDVVAWLFDHFKEKIGSCKAFPPSEIVRLFSEMLEDQLELLDPWMISWLRETGRNTPELMANHIYECWEDLSLERTWPSIREDLLKKFQALPREKASAAEIRDWFDTKPDLTHIEHLALHGLNLFAIPREIKAFKNLKSIDLSWNEIKVLSPTVFQGLDLLEIINLNWNELLHVPEKTFQGLDQLYLISLEHNNIRELPLKLLRGLGNLKGLYLRNNHLQPFDGKEREQFLQGIELEQCFMDDQSPRGSLKSDESEKKSASEEDRFYFRS